MQFTHAGGIGEALSWKYLSMLLIFNKTNINDIKENLNFIKSQKNIKKRFKKSKQIKPNPEKATIIDVDGFIQCAANANSNPNPQIMFNPKKINFKSFSIFIFFFLRFPIRYLFC